MIGIYYIKLIEVGKIYIGSSIEIEMRLYRHRWMLNCKKHDNIHLQRAWNKYGENQFEMGIVEECTPDVLIEREQYWINYYAKNSYNICKKANIPPSRKGVKLTEEHKEKISQSSKGRIISEEHKEKIRTSNTGQRRSLETRQKNSELAKRRKVTEETKAKLSAIGKLRRKSPTHLHIFCDPDGKQYTMVYLTDFANEHGFTIQEIYNVVSGRSKTTHGWSLISSTPIESCSQTYKEI